MSVTFSGSGQVVKQVIQTFVPGVFSTTSNSLVNITGASATITPTNSANKILIMVNAWLSTSFGTAGSVLVLARDGTNIGGGTAVGNDTSAIGSGRSATPSQACGNTICFLDSPATTSAVTYQLKTLVNSGYTGYVGQEAQDTNQAQSGRYPTVITLMEVAYA